jgi:hypothetical protein
MPRCEPNSSQKRQISYSQGYVSEHDGRRSGSFQRSPLTGCSRDGSTFTGAFFRVESGDGARERDRDVSGGNRRNGKGSSSSQSAGGHVFRQRGFGQPGQAVAASASRSEPPRACPPKQATVNSRAHVSVWIQAARTALGLERPTPSRLMHDSLRSRDEREWIIVRSFYPASRWTSHPE